LAARLTLLAVLALTVAACGRVQQLTPPMTDDAYTVTMTSEPSPPAVGPGALTFTLRDPAGQPVEGAQIAVEGNMSHAGMVPVAGAPASASTGGEYRVEMDWSMSGDWFVDVKFTLTDGAVVARRLPIQVGGK
jgi:hypothetical protein